MPVPRRCGTGMRTGREQLKQALVRTAYFSVVRAWEWMPCLRPARVRNVGGSSCSEV